MADWTRILVPVTVAATTPSSFAGLPFSRTCQMKLKSAWEPQVAASRHKTSLLATLINVRSKGSAIAETRVGGVVSEETPTVALELVRLAAELATVTK